MSLVSRVFDHHVVPGNFSGEVNCGFAPTPASLTAFGFPVGLVGLFAFCFGINLASCFQGELNFSFIAL